MKRLFLSLYLFVTLALLIISATSEYVWQQVQIDADGDTTQIIQLAAAIDEAQLIKSNMANLSQITQLPFALLPENSIQFLPEQMERLSKKQVISSYNHNDELLFFRLLSNKQLVQIGPVLTPPQFVSKNVFQSASYVLLAFAILMWSWPLWRALTKLQFLAKQYSDGKLSERVTIKKSSVIYPVASAFTNMAVKLAALIRDQKLMYNAVSHDIRTPLARLKFSTALLAKHPDIASEMQIDIEEIEQLIDELLNYGRLETQQIEVKLNRVNLSELLPNLITKLNRNDDKISSHIQPNLSCLCDGHLTERAIQNLITNAQRHCHKNVQVTAVESKKEIVITIEDDGDGVADQDKANIFTPFHRAESSRNKKSGGFGLGLAIVQRIANHHQGICTVADSSLGGAKFTFTIPNKGLI